MVADLVVAEHAQLDPAPLVVVLEFGQRCPNYAAASVLGCGAIAWVVTCPPGWHGSLSPGHPGHG